MKSLRRRLLAGTLSAAVLIFAASACAIYFSVRAYLIAGIDEGLLARARALSALCERDGREIKLELHPDTLPEYQGRRGPDYFQLLDGKGRAVRASPSLGGGSLPAMDAADKPRGAFCTLPSGRRARQLAFRFVPREEDREEAAGEGGVLTLLVAHDAHELSENLEGLRWVLGVVGAASVLVLVGLMAWVVGSGLRPLSVLAGRIAGIGDSNLHDRIDLGPIPRELRSVVERLNDLLGRLDAAMQREKSFTADAAHELRTPLAGLQTTLEVCASRPREAQVYVQTVHACLGMVRGMHSMVNNLLALARAESGGRPPALQSVPLLAALRESWTPFAARAAERQLEIGWPDGDEVQVCSNLDLLRIILHNLFDNVVCYCDAGGRISLHATRRGGALELTFANSASDFRPTDAEQVFERLWRADRSRSGGGHCGLGLTLCRKLAASASAEIAAEYEAGQFIIRLRLPLDPAI